MSTHRFILEPYKGVSTRHTCPNCHRQRCFSKYIDTEKQIQFPEYVGRCDHEQNAVITSRLVITLSRIRLKKKSLLRIVSEAMTPLKKHNP